MQPIVPPPVNFHAGSFGCFNALVAAKPPGSDVHAFLWNVAGLDKGTRARPRTVSSSIVRLRTLLAYSFMVRTLCLTMVGYSRLYGEVGQRPCSVNMLSVSLWRYEFPPRCNVTCNEEEDDTSKKVDSPADILALYSPIARVTLGLIPLPLPPFSESRPKRQPSNPAKCPHTNAITAAQSRSLPPRSTESTITFPAPSQARFQHIRITTLRSTWKTKKRSTRRLLPPHSQTPPKTLRHP